MEIFPKYFFSNVYHHLDSVSHPHPSIEAPNSVSVSGLERHEAALHYFSLALASTPTKINQSLDQLIS
jgi:hypothetical protein